VNAPPRLLDDPEVGEALKKDLQCAVEHQFDFDLAAGLTRFESALAGTATGSAVGQGALLKWLVVGAAGAGMAWALYLSSQTKPPTQAPAPQPVAVEETSAKRAAPEPSEAPTKPDVIRADELEVEQAPEAPIKMAERTAPVPSDETQDDAESPNNLLQREVAHLKSVRRALASDPALALNLANAGHAEFKGGVLYQEREALALQALNALGRRAELEQRGARYLKSFPSGSFSDQVRGMLKR
jgi:hypothetical protein